MCIPKYESNVSLSMRVSLHLEPDFGSTATGIVPECRVLDLSVVGLSQHRMMTLYFMYTPCSAAPYSGKRAEPAEILAARLNRSASSHAYAMT